MAQSPVQNQSQASNLLKQEYLNSKKSVPLQKYLDTVRKKEESGLNGIEVRKKAKALGKNDFLKLLVTQLSHQDPTKPMEDTRFIAQMAQFSSLEQMNNISSSMGELKKYQIFNLVDKFIIGKDFSNGQTVSGKAKAVFFDNKGQAFLRLPKGVVAFKDVISVAAAQAGPKPPSAKQPKASSFPSIENIQKKPAAAAAKSQSELKSDPVKGSGAKAAMETSGVNNQNTQQTDKTTVDNPANSSNNTMPDNAQNSGFTKLPAQNKNMKISKPANEFFEEIKAKE